VEHVRHEVGLDRKGEDGATRRAHLEAAARRGSQAAVNALEGPDAPDSVLYLMEWAYALCGRSGATMGGMAPLSFTTIRDWATLMDIHVSPLEVQALLVLDAVIRNPEPDTEIVLAEKPTHAWPERK